MIENAVQFFARYAEDESLRQRVAEAEAAYPGSLEIRDAVAEAVLLPIAAEIGLPFDLKDLRAYETRVKLRNAKPDVEVHEGEEIEEPISYWLLERGWEYDEDIIRRAERKFREDSFWR